MLVMLLEMAVGSGTHPHLRPHVLLRRNMAEHHSCIVRHSIMLKDCRVDCEFFVYVVLYGLYPSIMRSPVYGVSSGSLVRSLPPLYTVSYLSYTGS